LKEKFKTSSLELGGETAARHLMKSNGHDPGLSSFLSKVFERNCLREVTLSRWSLSPGSPSKRNLTVYLLIHRPSAVSSLSSYLSAFPSDFDVGTFRSALKLR
jgi:hypothetical protein